MQAILRSSLDILFPSDCLVCAGWGGRRPLCRQCVRRLRDEFKQPACPRCAATVAPYTVHQARCKRCRNHRLPVDASIRVGRYRDELAVVVRSYKYNARLSLEPLFVHWLGKAIESAPWRPRVEAITPVPTHWLHRFDRPFHAASALAERLATDLRIPDVPLLRRVRAGPHQIGLSPAERKRNVRGAFAMRRGVSLRRARVLLIDDVKTTGATVNECAKVLRAAGAAEVYVAVVATAGDDVTSRTVPKNV